jgi:tRNA (guanosine-2'-O-)-methyltransferase
MGGGGQRYEDLARAPEAESLLLEVRKERVDEVVARRTRSVIVVLDQLEDTFNMAAVLRTCEGMGLQEVHVIDNPEVPFEPHKKVTQGCDKWLDIVIHRDGPRCLAGLRERGYRLWASAIREGGQSLFEIAFDQKIALIFGNERHGIREELIALADRTFWIPMRGFTQSLNISAAVSASVTRAIAWRQERFGPGGDLTEAEAAELRQRFYALSVKQRKKLYGKVNGGARRASEE